MKGFLAAAALAGVAIASPMPQASGGSCSPDRAGEFTITVVNVTRSAKRDLEVRQQLDGTLMLTLEGGILKDQAGRTGYIAANRQFQFDNPIQAGAVVTSGWSSCSNNSLALGGSAIFYQCLSGTFYNLYDQSQGGQCNPIYIVAQSGSASTAAASVLPDGQPQATTAVTQLSDGQPQATSVPAPPVTVLSDGQPQATSVQGPPVTVLSDGQPQATSIQGPPVTVLSDGQPQATSIQGPPVTVLSDGQPQATTAQGPAVTVLSDGQPQAPTITQISDGQIQAPTSSAPIATFTGAANRNAGGFAFVAGIVGAVALL